MVEIEAWVYFDSGAEDVVVDVTAGGGGVGGGREGTAWWEGQGSFQEGVVTTGFGTLVDLGHEGLVQGEDVGVVVEHWDSGCCLSKLVREIQNE